MQSFSEILMLTLPERGRDGERKGGSYVGLKREREGEKERLAIVHVS